MEISEYYQELARDLMEGGVSDFVYYLPKSRREDVEIMKRALGDRYQFRELSPSDVPKGLEDNIALKITNLQKGAAA